MLKWKKLSPVHVYGREGRGREGGEGRVREKEGGREEGGREGGETIITTKPNTLAFSKYR